MESLLAVPAQEPIVFCSPVYIEIVLYIIIPDKFKISGSTYRHLKVPAIFKTDVRQGTKKTTPAVPCLYILCCKQNVSVPNLQGGKCDDPVLFFDGKPDFLRHIPQVRHFPDIPFFCKKTAHFGIEELTVIISFIALNVVHFHPPLWLPAAFYP